MPDSDNSRNLRKVVGHAAEQMADPAPEQADAATKAAEGFYKKEQRKAKTAGLRADEAEAAFKASLNEHIRSLNERKDVLQHKLNGTEEHLRHALPRVSELEHAERTMKVQTLVEGIGGGIGALSLAFTSFAKDDWCVYLLLGLGAGLSALSVFGKAIFAFCGWPPKPPKKHP